jgi:hypothetical protein
MRLEGIAAEAARLMFDSRVLAAFERMADEAGDRLAMPGAGYGYSPALAREVVEAVLEAKGYQS